MSFVGHVFGGMVPFNPSSFDLSLRLPVVLGYICPCHFYLRTRDLLKVMPKGGLGDCGRADSVRKHGGPWIDGDASRH